jgi:hypothetical protein
VNQQSDPCHFGASTSVLNYVIDKQPQFNIPQFNFESIKQLLSIEQFNQIEIYWLGA